MPPKDAKWKPTGYGAMADPLGFDSSRPENLARLMS